MTSPAMLWMVLATGIADGTAVEPADTAEPVPRHWISVAPDGTATEIRFSSDSSWLVSASLRVGDESEARAVNAELQRVAEPESVPFEPGESVEALVERRCGFADEGHVAAIRALNPALQVEAVERPTHIAAPPCVYFRKYARAVVAEGQTVSHLLMQATGFQGRDTLKHTRELNPGIRNLDRVAALEPIVLPYETRDVAFRVREDAATSASPILLANATNVQQGEMELVSRPAGAPIPQADASACAAPPPGWPFDGDAVGRILARYAERGRSRRQVFLAVVDTGLPLDAGRWIPLARHTGDMEAPPTGDNDDNGYSNDVFGIHVPSNGGYPEAPSVDEFDRAGHGLAVASVASGKSVLSPGTQPIEVKVLSVLQKSYGPDNSWRWFAAPATLSNALDYTQKPTPIPSHIVNWSWEGAARDPAIAEQLRSGRQLVVVAAGNAGRDLDATMAVPLPLPFPAAYSTIDGSIMLAVAALRPDGQLVSISNHGTEHVAIAAPGCAIPVIGLDGQPATALGTSFASPLVALTAAMIESLGVTNLRHVRDRILVSADRRTALAGKVGGGRVLNVPRALTLFDDIVELRTGETLVGRLQDKYFDALVGGSPSKKVRRVDFGESLAGERIALAIEWQDSEEKLKRKDVTCQCGIMHLAPVDGSAMRTFTGADVLAIIPAYQPLPPR